MLDASTEVTAVLSMATRDDPSIDDSAVALAVCCLQMLHEQQTLDVSELARRCLALHPESDTSWVIHVARAAREVVDH